MVLSYFWLNGYCQRNNWPEWNELFLYPFHICTHVRIKESISLFVLDQFHLISITDEKDSKAPG